MSIKRCFDTFILSNSLFKDAATSTLYDDQFLQDQYFAYILFTDVLVFFQEFFPEYLKSTQLLTLTIDEFSKTVGLAHPTIQMNDRKQSNQQNEN